MTIKDRLNQDVKEAMKTGQKQLLATLRLITAAVKQVEVDERIEVDDARMRSILSTLCKRRKESIDQFEKANRTDLLAQEQFELEVICRYLPEPLSDAVINQHIKEAIEKTQAKTLADMGKVMGLLKTALEGRADMTKVSAQVRAQLS